MPQPNILLLFADQHRADCLGINGHPFVQTPNLDALARAGANFTQAFTPIPLCSPSRTSLLTGLWPTQHGCIANADTEAFRPLLSGLPTVNQTLKSAGYFQAMVGKWGVDPKNAPTHYGYDVYIAEKDYLTWRKEQGLPAKPHSNRWFGEVDPAITPEQSQLAWGADRVIEWMRRAAQIDRPFLLHWTPSEPHLPNVVPEPYASLYPPENIPPWPNFADSLLGKPFIQRQQRVSWGIDQWTWAEWAAIVSRYLAEVTLLDYQIGRILATLDELGLRDNTLVIYCVDHGDLTGAHGMIDKHYVMYDELMRIPLLLRWPERIQAGQRCEEFVSSSIDLASTLCDAANTPTPSTFMGQSLLHPIRTLPSLGREPYRDDATRPSPPAPRSTIFSSYHGNQFGLYSQRMVRDRQWKYIWNATAEDELYDLVNDPGELTNLASQPAYRDVLQQLRQQMVHWMEETKDRLLNPWTKNQLVNGQKVT